jgi:hypothetical protein
MQQQFVLIGSQGSFPVPSGESRIGSDAACQICIRGDGVLPIHAYLSMDGEKVLIRPADGGTSSSGYSGATVTVSGKPLTGPASLAGGEEVFISGVQMRLVATGVKKPSLWSRRWVRLSAYGVAGMSAFLLLSYLFLIFVVLEEGRLKEILGKEITARLKRDEISIDSVKVRLFSGKVEVKNIKIKDRHNFSGTTPFITLPRATVSMGAWALLGCVTPLPRSWFGEYNNVQITLNEPEINIERARADGALNIDDILQRMQSTPQKLDATKLDFTVSIMSGCIRLRDNFTNVGQTSLENINVVLRQPALGQPLEISKCEMKVASIPASAETGTLDLRGSLNLIDDTCTINPGKLSSENLRLTMKSFDLARIFEHIGYTWEPCGINSKIVLGKPLTGQMDVKIISPKDIRVQGGLRTDSLLSIREENAPPLGNMPAKLDFSTELIDLGSGFRPHDLNLVLRSGKNLDDAKTTHLIFTAIGNLNPVGNSTYTVSFDCKLQDFLDTDIGRRLGLQGRIGGRLQGKANLIVDNQKHVNINIKLHSDDYYVMIPDPGSSEPVEKRAQIPQPIPLAFECLAEAVQSGSGSLSHIDIKSFTLRAPPSFVATSDFPGYIKGIDTGQLNSMAQFQLSLKGREFWTNFAPILALFGFTRPIEETMNLTVTIAGKDGRLSAGVKGTAARQWGPDPSPVELLAVADYSARAADPLTNTDDAPYLALNLKVASTEGKPLNVRLQAKSSREKTAETLTLESYGGENNEPGIKSDIETLRERFRPYIEQSLQSWDAAALNGNNGWLNLYKKTVLRGLLEQSGRVVLRRMLNQESPQPDTVSFDLNIAGRDLLVRAPFPASATDSAEPGIWKWQENDFKVTLKGDYAQRLSLNKEEPGKQLLNIEKLDVNGRLGGFWLTLRELDLFRLANLYNLPNPAWPDVLGGFSVAGEITPSLFDFLRSLKLLPENHPASGKLSLKVDFDRKKDSLNLEKFIFQQTDKDRDFFLTSLDLNGSLLAVRALTTRLLPARANAPTLSEAISYWLHENGPVALLDHLGDTLSINTLQLEMLPLTQWLGRDFKEQAGRVAPPLIASLLRKDWQPEGTWRAVGLRFTRDDPKVRRWTLVGDLLRNDFTCYGPPAAIGAERAPIFSFSHEWQLLMGLALSQDNSIALNANLVLDHSFIWASLAPFKCEDYKKNATEPCKIQIVCDAHGNLAQIESVKLIGGPIEVDMADFKIDAGANGLGSYSIGQLAIVGGPLPAVITVNKFDPGADLLNFRVIAPSADLTYLAKLQNLLPPEVETQGKLKDFNATYRGSFVALDALFHPDPEMLKARHPKLDPADPRLRGLNPETDMLEVSANLEKVSFSSYREKQLAARVKLGGQVKVTTRELSWDNLQSEITTASQAAAITHSFSAPKLRVNSLDAKLNLLQAAKSAGMPLDVNANITFKTPFDLAMLLDFQNYLRLQTSPGLNPVAEQNGFLLLEKLSASGSLTVPSLIVGDLSLPATQIPAFSLKALKLSIPAMSSEMFGGKAQWTDAVYDLSKIRLAQTNGAWSVKTVGHEQRFELADADLAALLGSAKSAAAFAVSGRISAQKGVLKGSDFTPDWRHTWDGAVKLKICDLAILPPARGTPAHLPHLPAWLAPCASWGENYCVAMSKAAGNDTINLREWSDSLGAPAGSKQINGVLLGLKLYLSKTFGVELEKLEFQPISPTIVISKGFAVFEPFQLVGSGGCEGLDLLVRNLKINLSTESFADDAGEGVLIYPVSIPKSAREKLLLSRWPPAVREEFLKSMEQGRLPLRVFGQLATPVMKFPWAELRGIARRALFDTDHILYSAALEKARAHFLRAWGYAPADVEAAAALADRTGVGLPGTATAREQGGDILERVADLPQCLIVLRARSEKYPAAPKISLEMLLRPEPDPPPGPGTTHNPQDSIKK